jgi:enediyne biosynthesis protein E7
VELPIESLALFTHHPEGVSGPSLIEADSLVPFCRAPQQFLLDRARTDGAVALYRIGPEMFASVSDPDLAHAVLHGDTADYEKGPLYDIVRILFGDGVFTAEREDWTNQHAVIAPLFARQRIRRLTEMVSELTACQVERWRGRGDHEDPDALIAMKRLAFDVVSIGLFSLRSEMERDALFDAVSRLDRLPLVSFNYLSRRVPLDRLGALVNRGDTSPQAIRMRVDDMLYAIADRRLSSDDQEDDVIGALIGSAFMGELPPERRRVVLRDSIGSLLTAGYVSTGESIFWALYHLARYPEVQARARAEVLVTPGPLVDAPPYLAAVLNESMRLFPPAWFIGRTTRRDVQLGGVDITAGTQVLCSPYVMHRIPTLWPDADSFTPERFLPGATVTPRSFIPFGSGPRACIGRALSLIEMTSMVSAALAHFDLELAPDAPPVTLTASYSMQPREPVRLRLCPRS